MENKITLDIDFEKDTNKIEEIPIKESTCEKKEDKDDKENKKQYIKYIISKGLTECEENYEKTLELKECILKFKGCGFSEDIYEVLDYILDVFDEFIPAILLGQYDKITCSLTEYGSEEENIELLKDIRKRLLKIFKN